MRKWADLGVHGHEGEESPELGDEGQAAPSGERIPVDPFIAFLEPEDRARPAENGAENGVAFIDLGLVDSWPF
ncbi:MAG: hypothetical protein QNL33_13065 [Akkermansiaceae bacterium]